MFVAFAIRVLLPLVLASGPDADADLLLLIRSAEAAVRDSDPSNDLQAVNRVLRAVQRLGATVEWKKPCIVMSLEANGKVRRIEERVGSELDGFEATLRCARRLIAE